MVIKPGNLLMFEVESKEDVEFKRASVILICNFEPEELLNEQQV